MSVLIFVEHWEGKFKKLSFELVSYGIKIAESLQTEAIVLCIGDIDPAEMDKLSLYGPDRIINVKPGNLSHFDSKLYTAVIAGQAEKNSASLLILSNNITGKALAPRLSVKLKAAIASGVSRLPISINPFIVYKKVFSGNAYAHLELKSEIKILTLAQNSFELITRDKVPAVETITVEADAAALKTKLLETLKQSGKILLTDAEIVVSGGRGMKSPDNWGPIIELAGLLGAATACSRPVSDEGWRPHEEHTGQTGKIIAPNLYFAIGISGATQHLAGVSSSKYIVAINTDKDAPIFSAAQYGIVGDAGKVLPKLVDAVKELKTK